MRFDLPKHHLGQTTPDHAKRPETRSVPVWVRLPPAPLDGSDQQHSTYPDQDRWAAGSKRAADQLEQRLEITPRHGRLDRPGGLGPLPGPAESRRPLSTRPDLRRDTRSATFPRLSEGAQPTRMWFARGLLLLLSGGVFVAAMIGYLIGHQPQRAPADPTTVTTIGGPR